MKRFPQSYLSYELDSLKKAQPAMGPGALEAQVKGWGNQIVLLLLSL